MSEAFRRRVRAELKALAKPDVREGQERYFKGVVRFHGVKLPLVRPVARACWVDLAPRGDHLVLAEALDLLEQPLFEEKHVGVSLLARLARRLPASFLRRLEPVFDRAVCDWATCDDLCGHVLRPMVRRDEAAARTLLRWSRHANPWRRRASAVAWVNEARHGVFTDQILAIAANVVRCPDRFAQLGAGWVLREVTLADRTRALGFLAEHRDRLSREALRYAVEKLPPDLRARVLAGPPMPLGRTGVQPAAPARGSRRPVPGRLARARR